MKRLILLFTLFWAASASSYSQETKFQPLTASEIGMKSYPDDSTANAVVLQETGNARMQVRENTMIFTEYRVRIKIFNSKGFEHGNITIPIRKTDNNRFETVSGISGFTTNVDENGALKTTELEAKKIFRENKNKYWDLVKFAMPDLREGSIIEYRYILESPYLFNFRKWEIQSEIPKISSQFIAHIPAIYNYNVTLKGHYKISDVKAELERECFNAGGGWIVDCSRMTYTIDKIPAFKIEDHMTAPGNFMSAINFELSSYQDRQGTVHGVTREWKDIDSDLKKSSYFGAELRRKDLFKDELAPLMANNPDQLSKAKAVYKHFQEHFKWNNFTGIYAENIKKAYEDRSGSIADINLSLVAGLNSAGLKAAPVLLSTRDNGLINRIVPVVSDFNYVIAKVDIEDKTYLLDASDPMLPFAQLPIKCVNDQGRVFSLTGPSEWIDLKPSHKLSQTYVMDLVLDESGKIKGTISNFSSGYEAYNRRIAIKKHNSTEEYVESLDENLQKIRILKSEIKGIEDLGEPISEIYEVEIDAFDNLDQDKFLMTPVILNRIAENPFKLAERSYPVDWGAPTDQRYHLSLSFPAKFKVIAQPPARGMALPNQGGRYQAETTVVENVLTFSQMIQFSKSVYTPQEYPYLKELFNQIIETQRSDIIFQRTL